MSINVSMDGKVDTKNDLEALTELIGLAFIHSSFEHRLQSVHLRYCIFVMGGELYGL